MEEEGLQLLKNQLQETEEVKLNVEKEVMELKKKFERFDELVAKSEGNSDKHGFIYEKGIIDSNVLPVKR